MLGLVVVAPLLVLRRPHRERPRRDQHEAHPDVVLEGHRHAVLLRLHDLIGCDLGPVGDGMRCGGRGGLIAAADQEHQRKQQETTAAKHGRLHLARGWA